MIEILIMIGVVKAFTKKASEKNLSKVLWGIIGAGSYYVPILVFSFFILPSLVMNGTINVTSETSLTMTAIGLNLLIGVVCCFTAYMVLSNMAANVPEANETVLDDFGGEV